MTLVSLFALIFVKWQSEWKYIQILSRDTIVFFTLLINKLSWCCTFLPKFSSLFLNCVSLYCIAQTHTQSHTPNPGPLKRLVPDKRGYLFSLSGPCPCWLTCCQLGLGLFVHASSISSSSMFAGPQLPKIEIIKEGRKKRKKWKRVWLCICGPPTPAPSLSSANLYIHSSCSVSSVFACFLERQPNGYGVETVCLHVCVVCGANQCDQVFQIITPTGMLMLSDLWARLKVCLSSPNTKIQGRREYLID